MNLIFFKEINKNVFIQKTRVEVVKSNFEFILISFPNYNM